MTYPFGIDVSSYQKAVDWLKARTEGVKFAFVKATEGASWVDPYFARNWSELRRLQIPHGAYHFYRAQQDISQIWKFLEIVKPEADELLVIDIENNGGLSRVELTTNLAADVEYIEFITGRYPIIYSRANWLNANLNVGDLPKLDYWLAQYKLANLFPFYTDEYPTESIVIPWGVRPEQVRFHQSGEKGNGAKFGAQSYYLDYDRFIGTEAELQAYFKPSYSVYLPIVITPEAPKPDALMVQPYSQNDPAWKNNWLGTSNVTIGQQGCLITCVAMVERYYGHDYTPATLNAYLTTHNGYANGNLLWWGRVPNMTISTWVDCLNVPAPLPQIDACLERGEPVIVHVDFVPSTAPINDHYVLLIGKLADEDYVMCDPWDGFVGSFKSRYKDARRFVYRIVSYRRQA